MNVTLKERRYLHGKLKELELRVKRLEDLLIRAKVDGDKLSGERTSTLLDAGLKGG